jgi:hypothetical protein
VERTSFEHDRCEHGGIGETGCAGDGDGEEPKEKAKTK